MILAAASPFVTQRPRSLSRQKFDDPIRTLDGSRRARVAVERLDTLWFNTGTLCNIACANCAARLLLQPTRSEPWEDWIAYDPAFSSDLAIATGCVRFNTATQRHEYLADSGLTEFWDCPHCGHASSVLNAVYAEDIADNFANLHIPEILSKYPTWAVWEYAAMPSDVMDLPPGVAALACQEGLYHNRLWYWVERIHSHTKSLLKA